MFQGEKNYKILIDFTYTIIQNFGFAKIFLNVFERSILCSSMQHLFD